MSAGKVPCAVADTSTVRPLGAALAAMPVPMAPLAPALLSVTTDTFHLSANLGPNKRAIKSAPVPVVNGTNNVTGPEGYGTVAALLCAAACCRPIRPIRPVRPKPIKAVRPHAASRGVLSRGFKGVIRVFLFNGLAVRINAAIYFSKHSMAARLGPHWFLQNCAPRLRTNTPARQRPCQSSCAWPRLATWHCPRCSKP